MRRLTSIRLLLMLSLFCAIGLFVPRNSWALLVNYENDPDLAMAMAHDGEYNGADLEMADQALAEKYYLRYLDRCTESSQRAKVYSQLGALFATSLNHEKEEKPDYVKCMMYMSKVLEEEPIRLGRETLRARGFRNTPLATREEDLAHRMEFYEWLLYVNEVVAAAGPLDEIWLPIIPGVVLTESQIRQITNTCRGSLECEANNMVNCADSLAFSDNVRIKNLQIIIDKFPNTEAAIGAAATMEVLKAKIAKDQAREMKLVSAPIIEEPAPEPPPPVDAAPIVETVEEEPVPEPPVALPQPDKGFPIAYMILGIVCGVVVLSAIYVMRRKQG